MRKTPSVSENRDANEASGGDDATTLEIGSVVTLRVEDLETLIARLSTLGYEVKGPVVRAGAIVPGALSSVDDLPKGVHDEQAPGGVSTPSRRGRSTLRLGRRTERMEG